MRLIAANLHWGVPHTLQRANYIRVRVGMLMIIYGDYSYIIMYKYDFIA